MKLFQSNKFRVERVVANFIRVLLIVAIFASILTQNWINLFIAALTLVFTFLPFIIAQKNHIYLPPGIQIAILLFIFASLYLGELRQYYLKFWWWDIMLHTFSGIILGFIGFLLTYILNHEKRINVILSPFFIALFSFTFAITVGTLWEIYEFAMDSIFGLNMQKSGLVDTMWDLIVDTLGALFSSVISYVYMKHKQKSFIDRFIEKFINKNTVIFDENLQQQDIEGEHSQKDNIDVQV